MTDHTRGRDARNATVNRRAQRNLKYTDTARVNRSGRTRRGEK